MTPRHPLLQFGPPPDGVAWAALLFAICGALLVSRPRELRVSCAWLMERPWAVLGSLALLATLLSAGYIHFYLRGGPRIIDATAYYLQARVLADGGMTFLAPAPSAAFRGRFLVPAADPGEVLSLGVLFPPGYPALLALGFAAGRPLWIGPLLGAGLVLVTFGLAHRLSGQRSVALLAAALSAVSAALRYHTADTMSHGWAALLFTVSLWACLGFRASPHRSFRANQRRGGFALVAGLSVGWLMATRPITGMVCAAACAWLMLRGGTPPGKRPGLGSLLLFGAALTPGVMLLLWQQAELTGRWLGSVQLRYYALADGPPGCFGLGLGESFGCRHEHGDVVARFGSGGFSPLWALRNTLHRLHHHTLDLANWEPAWLLVPWAAWRQRKNPDVRACLAAALAIVTAYGFFYFSGNYPGGGARFFAELIPLEHALIAWVVSGTAWARWLLPTALFGFACHGSYSHRDLAEREGGRPMFEPALVERALSRPAEPGIETNKPPPGALVFVDTDHGFNLGHDPQLTRLLFPVDPSCPGCPNVERRPVPPGRWFVARATNEDLDRLLWDRLGRPRAFRYQLGTAPGEPQLVALFESEAAPRDTLAHASALDHDSWPARPLRVEAEHEWPPLAVAEAWVQPVYPPVACVSNRRALALRTTGQGSSLGGELNVRQPGPHRVILGLVASAATGPRSQGRVVIEGQVRSFVSAESDAPCPRVDLGSFDFPRTSVRWTLLTGGMPVTLDYFEVTTLPAPRSGPAAPTPVGEPPL